MAEKTITLGLLRADRQPWDGGPVRLKVTHVNRSPQKVLFNENLNDPRLTLMNLDLFFNAGQVYGINVEQEDHRGAWHLINRRTFLRQQGGEEVESKDFFMRLMLVPRKPSSSDLDDGYDRLQERGSPFVAQNTGLSRESFLALEDDAMKLAFFNLEAKLRETRLNGIPLLNFTEAVRHVAVDRIFLQMRSEVKQLVDDSPDFESAPGHKAPKNTPVTLPAHPDSWKHRRFGVGNLQLSFSKTTESLPGNSGVQVFSVDADIDLERGLAHVGEWLDNKFIHPSRKTDQTQVYALLFSQGITTDYTLEPLAV